MISRQRRRHTTACLLFVSLPGLCMALVSGCSPARQPEIASVDVPGNVFSLQDELIAFQIPGTAGERFHSEISLTPLRTKDPGLTEETLFEYGPDSLTEVPFDLNDTSIAADVSGGKTYLVYARPSGRLRDIYSVLSSVDKHRREIEGIRAGLVDSVCRIVLCAPELLEGADLYALVPELNPLRSLLDIDDLTIGGWGSGQTACDRCAKFSQAGILVPAFGSRGGVNAAPKPLVVDMIPASLSGESNQDSEPFLAVDRSSPLRLVGTAFTPNPFGTAGGTAPVYLSTDGGNSWTLNNIVPSAGSVGTSDITVTGTGTALRLYSGIIRVPGNVLLNILRTMDFTAATTMAVQSSRDQVDQPFAQAATEQGVDRVYVGGNDFNAGSGQTASIDVSVDGGGAFKTLRIETRSTAGQDGPSIRPAVAGDGTVYAAYFGWRSFSGTLATSDVVVVRDDNGASGSNPFQALKDPSDNRPGRIVVSGRTIPWSNAPTLGFERIGSTLSLAVDPSNSSRVFLCWADRTGNGDIYTMHVRRSTDRGATWSNDLRTIANATCCALAIADSGTVGFLYQQLAGSGAGSRWVTRLEQTRDDFAHQDTTTLATVPGDAPPEQFLPYIGDYNFLLAVDGEFRGIFAANNTPDLADFPSGVRFQRSADFSAKRLLDGSGNSVDVSIDPFYFSVPAIR